MLRFIVIAVSLLVAGVASAEPTVDELIARLSDKSPEVRKRAASDLGHRVREAARFDPLEKAATSDPDPTVRFAALSVLAPSYIGVGKTPRWKAMRIKLLGDSDVEVRRTAANQLRPAEPDTFDAHYAALKKETDGQVQSTLVLSLGDAKAPRLADALIALVERGVTIHDVMSTLARTKDPRATEVLADAVRRGVDGAIYALRYTRDPKVADVLVEVLPTATGDNVDAVVAGLIEYPDARAVPALVARWNKLTKADKKSSSRSPKIDEGEDEDVMPFALTGALRAIAEIDPAPCTTAKTAKGELKKYLKKILPKKCGTGAK